jgi:hypothetical protein
LIDVCECGLALELRLTEEISYAARQAGLEAALERGAA